MGNLIRKIRRNISATQDGLMKRREILNLELSEISKIEEDLKLADDFLEKYPPNNQNFLSYYNKTTANYLGAVTNLNIESKNIPGILTSGSGAVTLLSSYYAEIGSQASPLINSEIETLRTERNDTQVVYKLLLKVNDTIANIFLSSWQALSDLITDPARGPAFLMREVIYQFFHHYAPNDLIEKMNWYVPSAETNGVIYPDRIKYIFEEVLPQSNQLPSILDQLKGLRKIANELNSAHDHGGELDFNIIKARMYLAQDYLKSLLIILSIE